MAHHPGVVAAAQYPGGGVLPDPLVLRGRLVGDANSVPAEEETVRKARSRVLTPGVLRFD